MFDIDVVHDRAAGIDISKQEARVAVRRPGVRAGQFVTDVTSWPARTNSILGLVEMLQQAGVTTVVMEATSDYWKPFYFLMEDAGLPVMLVNARQAKNIPGRKSDTLDAVWLSQLAAHGLLRASFVPPEPIRQLRDLTRGRKAVVGDQTRIVARLEKSLESSGIKLSAVVSDLSGVSSRAILTAMVAGERDPKVLAQMAKGPLRAKIGDLEQAMVGQFGPHHAFMVQQALRQYDAVTEVIAAFEEQIDTAIAPFRHIVEVLTTIPGVGDAVAEVIIAETGGDMSVFPTEKHLASWAGVSPGRNESAGKNRSSKTLPGDKHLTAALGNAASRAARLHGTYLANRYWAIARRRGEKRALVAIEHAILVAVWHMLSEGVAYTEPEPPDAERAASRTRARLVHELERQGWEVTLTPAAA